MEMPRGGSAEKLSRALESSIPARLPSLGSPDAMPRISNQTKELHADTLAILVLADPPIPGLL